MRKLMMRRLVAGAAVLAVAGVLAVAPASAAQAALTCSGTQVAAPALHNNNGTVVGRVGVYRDGPLLCAVLIKQGPLYGVSTYTKLHLYNAYNQINRVDAGYYQYQTNALTVDLRNSSTGCVTVDAQVFNTSGVGLERLIRAFCR